MNLGTMKSDLMHRTLLELPSRYPSRLRQHKRRPRKPTSEPQETPLRLKVSSGTLLPKQDLAVPKLQTMLRRELDLSVFEDIPNLPAAIFPDAAFAGPLSRILGLLSFYPENDEEAEIATSSDPATNPYRAMYNKKTSTWAGWPDLSKPSYRGDRESALCTFLNDLGSRISAARDGRKAIPFTQTTAPIPPSRTWTSAFSGKPLPGNLAKRKPDLILFDTSLDCKTHHWRHVLSTLSLKSNADAFREAKDELTDHALHTFAHQDNRRFNLSISICNTLLSLSLHDRTGAAHSGHIEAHKNPEQFLRVVAGLFSGTDTNIGFDPTIKWVGDKRIIEAGGKNYTIIKTDFINEIVRGRGTVCWHVQLDGQHYAVKDSWADETREFTEATLLKKCSGIQDIPTVVWEGDVKVDGKVDKTENWRGKFSHIALLNRARRSHPVDDENIKRDMRVHRRIVITPYAKPITSFQSKRELLQAFIDIAIGEYGTLI